MLQVEPKLKARLMDFFYLAFLNKQTFPWIQKELRRLTMPQISEPEWLGLQDYFRQKEIDKPAQMAAIRSRIRP